MISPGYIYLIHEILMLARSELQYGVTTAGGLTRWLLQIE